MSEDRGKIEKVAMRQCNFSIPEVVYDEYRKFCKANGLQMSFPISIFMQQFSRGQFNFVFSNNYDHSDFLGIEIDKDAPLVMSDGGNKQAEKVFVRLIKSD